MKDLTKGNIYKTLLLFAIPMVLSGLLSQAYSTINTILAGKLLGDNALAATGAIAPFQSFVDSMFWGYGMGLGIYVSQLFGAKDYPRMKSTIINNLIFITTVVAILSVLFLVFRYNIYSFLKVDQSIIADCNRYFVIIVFGKAILLFGSYCVPVLNAMGESAFPLFVSTLSAILNIVIGAVSIAVFHTGVEGLAIGSVVSAAISSLLYIVKLSSVFKKLELHKEKYAFHFQAVRETGRYAVSTMVQQSIMYFAGLVLSPMINNIGAAASASYTVTLRVYNVNASIYQNSAKSVSNYTAQSFGAKKYHLLKKGIRVGALQNLLFVMPTLLVSCLFAPFTASLFYNQNSDPVSIGYSVTFLQYFLPFIVLNVFANLFHNFFRGIGRMRALLITTIVGSVARIIVSWILIKPFGIYGYYAGWVLSWAVDAAVGAVLYFFGKWRKILPTD